MLFSQKKVESLHLHHPHVESRLRGQLFPDVACWLWRVLVGTFEGLQLLGCDGGPGPLGSCLGIVWKKNIFDFYFTFETSPNAAFVWRACVCVQEVSGHAVECIIVLVHLSHSHSGGHKSTQWHRNGATGAAPYKCIGSLYIINQRCMEISEGREGQRQHTHERQTPTIHSQKLFHCIDECIQLDLWSSFAILMQ